MMVGIITTGSEYPPQQSAKQTAGSGLCKAYARRSSPTLNFVVGFKSACSHFKHPQMWPNKLSEDKGLQICYTTSYIVLAQEGAESWFERVPLRNTNSHQIAGNFFPLDGAQIVVELEWILGSRKQKTLFRSTWEGRLEWQPRIECSIVCALIEKGPTLYAAYMTLLTADLQLMYINGGQKTNLWQR